MHPMHLTASKSDQSLKNLSSSVRDESLLNTKKRKKRSF